MSKNNNYLFQYLEKENIAIDQAEFEFQLHSHSDVPSMLAISDTLQFFNIENTEKKIVFQGVHMIFGGHADRAWERNERRTSEMVVIGKDLDEKWFQEQFEKCASA